ncbi:phosphate/phosphite/phosphonate ABC transporter substrate-binding protein [Emcibacter sp.]|uniref:phosphate/phosphite/phosphonate ABC transporter substrate-binding protein n=1 Tax=Emcibacter sp. TaxID=1979954 RepID=UPI002AA61A8C|nr:PhnD/SsuA/transferrin family substrate-binding protein [Emcibacter sp.]
MWRSSLFLFFCQIFLFPAASFAVETGREFIIASISDTPSEEIKKFQALADYLQDNLKEFGYESSRVLVARTTDDIANAIQEKQVDLFLDSPLVVESVNRKVGSRTILRRWKKGKSHYHTVIFSLKNSPVLALPDLKSQTIAFDSKSSTSGFLMPRAMFLDQGLPLRETQPGQDATPDNNAVNFVISGHDENTLTWVLHQRVDAGAMSNQKLEKLTNSDLSQLKIIDRSNPIPRHAVTFSPHLSEEIVDKLVQLLSRMHLSEKGRKVLKKAEKTAKFDVMPETELVLIRELYDKNAAEPRNR